MTNEEYLRSALLGGMQLTSLLSRPRGSAITLTAESDPQAVLSLPELETLQRAALDIPTLFEVTREILRSHLSSVRAPQRTTHSVAGVSECVQSLSRVSQDAQWQSLRTDILFRLESIYVFHEEGRVKSFLEQNSFLAPLLLEASIKIREYFSPSSKIALEVSIDPDNSKYQELWVRVQTSLAPTDALSLLTRFDEEWWIDASPSSQNLLNINLEYA